MSKRTNWPKELIDPFDKKPHKTMSLRRIIGKSEDALNAPLVEISEPLEDEDDKTD